MYYTQMKILKIRDVTPEELDSDPTANAVINGGLSVCKVCGEFEAGLYKPCRTR